MRSSTSNSDFVPDPALSYFKIAVTAALVAGLLFAAVETVYRGQGFTPAINDTETYWAIKRSDVYTRDGRKRLVIVGSSRAHLGLEPEAFRREFPSMDIVHLAIDGKSGYSVLKDLAEDPEFDGWILADFVAWNAPNPDAAPDVKFYHDYFEKFPGVLVGLNKKVNTLFTVFLQERFAVLSPVLSVFRILFGKNIRPWHCLMNKDRYRPAYMRTQMTPEERQEFRADRLRRTLKFKEKEVFLQFPESYYEEAARDLKQMHEKIIQKGGRLILIRMPTSDERWAYDQFYSPKKYWDRLREWVPGIETIHFKDYPQLDAFSCPDTSHLDALDAPEFSRRLAVIIRDSKSQLPEAKTA